MNKRGTILDAIYIMGLLFIVAIIAAIGIFLSDKINTAIQGSDIPADAKVMNQNLAGDIPGAVDFIFLMVFIGLPIASLVLAFFNNIHPILFYITVALSFIILFAAIAYAQLWDKFQTTTVGVYAVSNIPMTNFILEHMGVYTLLVIVIILFGTYIKSRNPAGY